ncbi:MAG: DUF2339 domain-containing protein, partial [Phycisphaerae bacterium]|nr:DUF2339 domain-containing protein [Phycisphaerae bacterium]
MSSDNRPLPDGPLKREFDRLMERLDAIDARLDRIERNAPPEKSARSQTQAPTPPPTPVTPKPMEPQAVVAPANPIGLERVPVVSPPATPPAPSVPPLLDLLKERKKLASVASDVPDTVNASDPSPRVGEPSLTGAREPGTEPDRNVREREPGTLDTASLESFLGGRVAAWVGAIVVVIAAGFFVKFAYDQGWIQKTPPAVRLLIAAIFGGLFLGAGEIALRRFGRPAAVGAFGAGVGTLIVTALASARPLNVLSEPVALLASTLIAGVGIGVAWRSRSVAVGGLSILGGLLAPMVLEVLTVPGAAVPFHLTAVLALGLGISAIAESPFRPLRWLSIVGIMIAAVPWFFVVGRHTPALSMPIVMLWWAMIIAESAWAAVRGQSTKANILAAVVASGAAASISSLAVFGGNRWASVFGYTPLFLAVLAWLTASQLAAIGDEDDAAHEDERSIAEATSAYRKTLRILTGALIAAGVGVLFRYGGLAVTWAALAVAYMEIGRNVKSRWAFGLGLFALRGAIIAVIATIIVGFLRGPSAVSLVPTFVIILPDGWWSMPIVWFACLVAGTRWMRFDKKVRETTVDWGDTFTFIAYVGWMAGSLAMGRDFAISALLLAGAIPAAIALYVERPREWAQRTVAYPITLVLFAASGLAWWLCAFQSVADNDMPWLALAIPLGIA